MPEAGGTMVTKIPKIPTLVGLESKRAAGKRTNKYLRKIMREEVKHKISSGSSVAMEA